MIFRFYKIKINFTASFAVGKKTNRDDRSTVKCRSENM